MPNPCASLCVLPTKKGLIPNGSQNGEKTNDQIKQGHHVQPAPLPQGCCRWRRRDRRRAGGRAGAGPDQHALAEHLAGQGYFPRIRARLRQEGKRHDRRRPQDRGASRRRRGARLRPARRRLEGHARWRPRRAGLSLRQAERAGAVGFGPGLCDGRQHAARLAQVRRRQGAAGKAVRLDRRQCGLVPVWADADPAARLVQEAGHQGGGSPGRQVPDRRHLDRRVHRSRRRRQRAAGRRDRLGDGPRPAGRRRVQQRHLGPHPRLRRRFQGLHVAELPPERRAIRDHVQQDQVRCTA